MVSDKPKPLFFSPSPYARVQFSGWWMKYLLYCRMINHLELAETTSAKACLRLDCFLLSLTGLKKLGDIFHFIHHNCSQRIICMFWKFYVFHRFKKLKMWVSKVCVQKMPWRYLSEHLLDFASPNVFVFSFIDCLGLFSPIIYVYIFYQW